MAIQEAYSPEIIQERRSSAEIAAQKKADMFASREYAQFVSKALRTYGTCALVLIADASPNRLIQGLSHEFGEDHIFEWTADGNVQGRKIDNASARYAVNELETLTGEDVLILTEYSYRQSVGKGTPIIADAIERLATLHSTTERRHPDAPMILTVGIGSQNDLPAHEFNRSEQAGIAADFCIRFALAGEAPPTSSLYH
jgi:uncharacterized protein (DUF2249 family)